MNELGLDAGQVNSLLNLDPDVVRESADAGRLFLHGPRRSRFESAGIDRDLPDVGAVLDRVAAELGRELAQVEIVGADAGAVAAGVSLSLATDGGNLELPDVAELPDIGNSFSVALELEPETGNLEGGVSARDFLASHRIWRSPVRWMATLSSVLMAVR